MALVCDNLDCGGSPLSIIEYDGGVWLVGTQLTSRLGYYKSATVLRQHCPDRVLKPTKELKDAGVPTKGSRSMYLVPFESAVRLVMKCDLPKSGTFRKVFLFVVIPYIFTTYPHLSVGRNIPSESMATLIGALSSTMRKEGEPTETRIIGEYKIKQVGK